MTLSLRRLLAAAALGCAAAAPARASSYDDAVLADKPLLYLTMAASRGATEPDQGSLGLTGTYIGGMPAATTLPNGDLAPEFDGRGQYLSVPSRPGLSVPAARALTIESWIKPSVEDFPTAEADGYVYWLGKGDNRRYEYANRMYSRHDKAGRPNRISVYAWNPSGGLGSGAYFQDKVVPGEWIHVVDVIDMDAGTIAIYKDGMLRKTVPLSQYKVKPKAGDAPFNVGTRSGQSWFAGAVGKVAVYGKVLPPERILAHYRAMTGASQSVGGGDTLGGGDGQGGSGD